MSRAANVMGPERAQLRAKMRERYELDGLSVRELAAEFGRSYGATSKLLHEAGTRMRPRGGNQRNT